jgi:hypothetical protein
VQGAGGLGRTLFAASWIAVQGALVLTAGRRPDGAFGFRMFHESSTVQVALYREIRGESGPVRVRVEDGTWNARDRAGTMRRFTWYDRVRRPELGIFDREISASYGVAAQLWRFQAAVDDVATHLVEDTETRRLVLEVTVRKNGREPRKVELTSTTAGGSKGDR